MKQKIKTTDKKNGFTLMEVLVAVLILSLSLAGLAGVLIMGGRQTSVTSNKAAALYHAHETLKKLQDLVADEPAGGFGLPETNWFDGKGNPPDWQRCDADATWGNCYVLKAGNHIINPTYLPDSFKKSASGNIGYQVISIASPDPLAGWKKVSVTVNWSEPSP